MKLLIATHNRAKLREYRELLQGLALELVTLDDVGIYDDVVESGTTFEENARLKAVTYAKRSGLLALADDSGLEIDALGGEPGVHSKRYAGGDKTDAERNALVLEKLGAAPRATRTARFRCVIVVADPQGRTWMSQGTCEGEIAFAPRGTHGFGYDPIFIVSGLGKHMAELELQDKNRISHRGRAAAAIHPILNELARRGG